MIAHRRRWLVGAAVAMALAAALILIAAAGQPTLAADGIIYVDADAEPGGGGTSWADAYTELQAALDAAVAPVEIWVASGTYRPTDTTDRNISFQMANGVAIYGGFAGTETERGQRDWEANPTILSGDLNGDDLPEFASREDNSYHVFYHPDGTGLDDTAILDGFIIASGNANGPSDHNYGGGMYNDYSSPSLANCAFRDNSTGYYGGGMYNKHASPALTGVSFEGNLASNAGGGMTNYSGSSPTLVDCTFTSNRANGFGGGGMLNSSATPTLTNCTFNSNWSDFGGGAMRNDSSPAVLANCSFIDNSAEHGGGMYNTGSSAPTLTNCTFTGNSGDYGGGINNYYTGSLVTLKGCTFTGNLADYGAGSYNNNSEVSLTNCTFFGNTAGQGGGIYNSAASSTLTNCILWADTPQEIHNASSSADVTYSDIQGDLYPGAGNINGDPLFVDPDNGDLRLQLTSPAIDAGNNEAADLAGITTDLGGHPRFADTLSVDDTGNGDPPIVDMGAHEAPPDLVYVDQDATGTSDGSSWDDAFTSLQDALTWALDGVEVWVAEGTYKPTNGDDHTASFQMVNGVAIFGGFDPSTGDTDWQDRDWEENLTILSGDIGTEGDSTDNSYHVFYHPLELALDSTAILDGFTITGGNADGEGAYPNHSGGGMYNKGSSPTLVNLTFTDNSAWDGGGMTNSDSSPELTNCTFESNSANDGGGMFNVSSSPTLTNCTFQSNSAGQFGGGMINNGFATLTNCTFRDNSAGAYGGGMYNIGSSVPSLANCTFTGNSATDGGGMYNTLGASPALTGVTFTGNSATGAGGGMDNTGGSSPILTGCTFSNNTAGDEGGGMLNEDSSPTLTGCTFSVNTADAGGGMHNNISAPTLTNVTFAGNEASSGGGMHNNESSPVLINCTFWGNSAQGHGGGMRNKSNSLPTLTNCTFHGNSATNGGAIQNYQASPPTLTNCILWGDSHPEIYDLDSAAPDVTFSDVEGGYLYPGTGNINQDPLFMDPDNGDLHLLPGSPCIDAGTDAAPFLPIGDFEDDPRSMDGDRDGTATVDMGVDEALWHPVYLPLVLRGY